MDSRKLVGLLLLLLIILAYTHLDYTRRTIQRARDAIAGHGSITSIFSESTTDSASPGAGPAATPAPDAGQTEVESKVESYMRRYAAPQSTLTFLDWADYSATRNLAGITVHYRVQKPSQPDVEASVRFTLQNGNIIRTQVVQPGPQPASVLALRPMDTPPPVYIDHFSRAIMEAMNGTTRTMHLSDAFSLAQLPQAEATAKAERKPLGFLMVWGQFFDHDADSRGLGSDSALVHFYQVFGRELVLVFVRHESELGMVPAAVKKGFFGPDEGGFAPNLAVTDASAREFITEIPYRHLDGSGRDPVFTAGARKIDQWLEYHPDAMADSEMGTP